MVRPRVRSSTGDGVGEEVTVPARVVRGGAVMLGELPRRPAICAAPGTARRDAAGPTGRRVPA